MSFMKLFYSCIHTDITNVSYTNYTSDITICIIRVVTVTWLHRLLKHTLPHLMHDITTLKIMFHLLMNICSLKTQQLKLWRREDMNK